MRIIGFTYLFFFFYVLSAQTDAFNTAVSLEEAGNYQEAYKAYKEAGDLYYAKNEFSEYVNAHLCMVNCQLQDGDPFHAKSLAENTLDFIQVNLKEASTLNAQCQTLLGLSYLNLGRNDDALEQLLKAEKIFEEDSKDKANCLDAMGLVYTNNENKELASQYLEQALKIRRKLFGLESIEVANSFNNLGRVYLKEDPLQAVIYFNRARSIYEELLGNSSRRALRTRLNIAYASMEQKNYEEALELLNEVKRTYETIHDSKSSNVAFTQSIIGRVYLLQGSYEEALINQNEALQMFISLFGEKHPDVANTYFLIGEIYKAKSEFKLAVEFYQRAIYSNLPGQSPGGMYELPVLQNYFNADILLSSLQAKAIALEALHFEKSLNVKDLTGAIDTYVKCDELISAIRRKRLNEQDKLRLGQISKDVYERGIELSLILSEQSFNRKKHIQRAFEFCERSKSSVLLEAITESKAKAFAGIPTELILLEDSLKDEISYLEQQLAASEESNEQQLKDLLFSYQNSYREFINQLESNYPEYYDLKYSQKIAQIEEVQRKLSDQGSLISYFIGKDQIYSFIITKKDIKTFRKKKGDDFDKLTSSLRNAIKYNISSTFYSSSSKLYDLLIPKLPSYIQEIAILPDGSLGTIPFEVLVNSSTPSVEYSNAPFLIKQYHLSYDYSATLFIQREKHESSTTPKILLIAPVNFDQNEVKMNQLPDSETEINEIELLFLGNNCEPTIQLKEDASEANFKNENLSNYRFVHFATHGQVNESEPALSRIFLTPNEDQDGSLYTGEIYNLNINADLVTLSACETGLGKVAKGEGIVGLSRALQYAGANNIIVSLWQVADASTAQMMIEFYKYNLNNDHHGYNAALRQAKLQLLNSEQYSRPYFWAPFILVGI